MDNLFVILGIYVAVLLVLIFSGMPIVFALGILALGSLLYGFGPQLLPALARVSWDSMVSFVLVAIPLFLFMGYLLFESGLSTRIYGGISPLLDRLLPGGLLHSNIVVGAVFAACSGSSIASCATIGSVALPEMERRGYDRGIAAGSVAAGGGLGVLIPPSIVLIVYGAMTEQSVGKLFIGGIIPGLMLAAMYMTYIALRIRFQPRLVAGGAPVEKLPWKTCLMALLRVWPVLLLIVGVLGSIYGGVATPSEAAAIGCALVFVLAIVYRLLTWDVLKRSLAGAVRTASMILLIFLAAHLMGIYLSNSGLTRELANYVSALAAPPLVVFMGIFLMYIIMGMLMDSLAAQIMTIPITFPIVMALGYDPIWYGIMLVMFGESGLITPPVGMNLYVLQGLRPEYPFMQIVKGCMPYFGVILVATFILIAFPQLVTFLPTTMLGP